MLDFYDDFKKEHPLLTLILSPFIVTLAFLMAIFIFVYLYHLYSGEGDPLQLKAYLYIGIFIYLIFLMNFFEDYESKKKRLNREAEQKYKERRARESYIKSLRDKYEYYKRLPKFICKNCLKSIIVKNIDIVCPFCDAEFRVTDTEKTKQIGDVYASGVRNLINESTMEKILFKECPSCGGKIKYISCYHCDKEIDLFENYNEQELEKKRYE